MNENLTAEEYAELVALSVVLLPNMDRREFNVRAAEERQLQLYQKAVKKYSYYQDVEFSDGVSNSE